MDNTPCHAHKRTGVLQLWCLWQPRSRVAGLSAQELRQDFENQLKPNWRPRNGPYGPWNIERGLIPTEFRQCRINLSKFRISLAAALTVTLRPNDPAVLRVPRRRKFTVRSQFAIAQWFTIATPLRGRHFPWFLRHFSSQKRVRSVVIWGA